MITLSADNRVLTENAKYSYLVSNYASGVSSFSIINASDGFAADDYLLLGNMGSESAEIVKIATVNTSTGAITTTAVTKFSHSESSRVTRIPYNQVKFYRTTTTTFAITGLLSTEDIHVSDWFTTYNDESNSTGYGWFVFYNETTAISSQESNYMPYEGFDRDSIEDILSDFYSLLNNKELKLVTRRDALSWFNEGVSRVTNRLNRSNKEYNTSDIQTLSIVSGTGEYDLPSDFNQLISITDSNVNPRESIEYIPLKDAYSYEGSTPMYYIRGKKIGIVPTPTTSGTYYYNYLKKASKYDSNSDSVDLPDNGFYIVKDFMMYRAYMKFTNPNAVTYLKLFNEGLDDMIISSKDRDCNLDSFSIDYSASV